MNRVVLILIAATSATCFGQAPASPPFRMEYQGAIGSSQDGPRNEWAVVNVGSGPKVAWIDAAGTISAFRLVSWDTTNPVQLQVSKGGLLATHLGRTYQLVQQVRVEQRLEVVWVTRLYQGLIFAWPHTALETVPVTVAVPYSMWLEVEPSQQTKATPSST